MDDDNFICLELKTSPSYWGLQHMTLQIVIVTLTCSKISSFCAPISNSTSLLPVSLLIKVFGARYQKMVTSLTGGSASVICKDTLCRLCTDLTEPPQMLRTPP